MFVVAAVFLAHARMASPVQPAHGETQNRVISVCDVLADPIRYRQRVVTVRGIYFDGLRQDCAQPLVTARHAWPKALSLVDAKSSPAREGEPALVTDLVSWERLDKLVVGEAKARRKEEIWADVTGFLRAPERYVDGNGVLRWDTGT